uniref:TauD/TfdA-like domain-containing protein n=1 Tax=Kwoniella pini CBS 10737 TaxID=1296096 RepID=A0A1B9I1U5_9TREE|nr:uncharacterized protein I206_05121 [Kwoniella pini CBS 10737]OCF49428.1 hypothetical protein I206_05121 [Kwoniella pini CBS 10737]
MTLITGSALQVSPLPLKGSRQWKGHQFPIAFRVDQAGKTPDIEQSVSYLHGLAASGEFTHLLQQHGGVVFRGFGSPSAETFSKLVNAAERGRNNTPYEQVGLAGKRTAQASEVYTANEGPETQRFFLHNEYARYTRYPGFIHFYCEVEPITGGESPIGNSLEMFDRIVQEIPEFVKEVNERGLSMTQIYPAPYDNDGKVSWKLLDTFGQTLKLGDDQETIRQKVEAQVRRLTDDYEWLEDGSIRVVQHVKVIHPRQLDPDSFHLARHGTATFMDALEPPYKGTDGKTYPPATYTDGTEIPRAYLDRILAISRELEIPFKWEAGDILFVDNLRTMHGRAPWSDGPRRILVSMWDVLPGTVDNYRPNA